MAAPVFRVSGQGAFLYFSGEGKSGGRFPSLQVSENFRRLQPEGEAALVGFSGAVRAPTSTIGGFVSTTRAGAGFKFEA